MSRIIYGQQQLRPESGLEQGLRTAAMLQQIVGPILAQQQQKKALEAQELSKENDFQRQLRLKQAMGELGGLKTGQINQAKGGMPASVGAIPVDMAGGAPTQEEASANYIPVGTGSLLEPSLNKKFQQQKLNEAMAQMLKNEKAKGELENELALKKPQAFSPGTTLGTIGGMMKGEEGIKIADRATAPQANTFQKVGNKLLIFKPGATEPSNSIDIDPTADVKSTAQGIFKEKTPGKGDYELIGGTAPVDKTKTQDLKPILAEKANNALSVIKDIKPLIGTKTVGTMGNVRRFIPFSANEAKLLQGKVNALKSQISMSELLKMKEAGASFGALSDTELALLGNSVDTLDLELQDAPTLAATIHKIEALMQKSAGGPSHGIGSESESKVKSLVDKYK
jgi:hypothetical protein